MSRHERFGTEGEEPGDDNVVPLNPDQLDIDEAIERHPASGTETVEETLARLDAQRLREVPPPEVNDIE